MTALTRTRALILTSTAALIAVLLTMAWALGGRTPAPPSASAAENPAAGITVSADGTVSGTPDALQLVMSLSTSGTSVSAALEQANTLTNKVFDALKANGVKDADMQTSNLSIQQDYDDKGKVTGYQVTESLTAVLRDLKSAGATIGKAAAAGGNATRVDSVSLDLSDSSTLMSSARDRAMAEAKKKAEQYAKASGRSLGQVQSISESVTQPNGGYVPARAGTNSAEVPIQAGSQEVSVTVTVVYAFG